MRIMRRLITILCLIPLFGGALTTPAHAQDPASSMLAKINELRAQNGLNLFSLNPSLAAAAQQHSQYLASNPWGDAHREANGSTPQDRAAQHGYSGPVSENVVGGSNATVEWGFNWWMNSAVHRSNLLGPYTEIGIGYAEGAYGRWFTAVFGGRGGGKSISAPVQPVAGGGSAAPAAPAATQRPQPTRPPPPTLTPTDTLTPTNTFTPRPTFTATFTATGIPPTATAIVLEISPQAGFGGVGTEPTGIAFEASPTASLVPPSPTSEAAVVTASPPLGVALISTSDASPAVESPEAAGNHNPLRTLIPILIVVQGVIVGGLVLSGMFRRKR